MEIPEESRTKPAIKQSNEKAFHREDNQQKSKQTGQNAGANGSILLMINNSALPGQEFTSESQNTGQLTLQMEITTSCEQHFE